MLLAPLSTLKGKVYVLVKEAQLGEIKSSLILSLETTSTISPESLLLFFFFLTIQRNNPRAVGYDQQHEINIANSNVLKAQIDTQTSKAEFELLSLKGGSHY